MFDYLPGNSSRVLVARTFESAAHGLDYWTMNLNGSDAQRLTFTNQPGTEHLGYTQTLGLAFDPHGGIALAASEVDYKLAVGLRPLHSA